LHRGAAWRHVAGVYRPGVEWDRPPGLSSLARASCTAGTTGQEACPTHGALGPRRDLRRRVAAGVRSTGAAGPRVRQTIAALGGRARTAALGPTRALRRARAVLARLALGWRNRAAGDLAACQSARGLGGGGAGVGGPLVPAAPAPRALVCFCGARRAAAGAWQGLPSVLADLPVCAHGGKGARTGDGDRAR